eukprot:scaffold53740_cov68-Phaeocystis_antarctica.AAC.1
MKVSRVQTVKIHLDSKIYQHSPPNTAHWASRHITNLTVPKRPRANGHTCERVRPRYGTRPQNPPCRRSLLLDFLDAFLRLGGGSSSSSE